MSAQPAVKEVPGTEHEHASCTRTDGPQGAMDVCLYCHELFKRNARLKVPQRFCRAKCRSAYAREVGLIGSVVVIRRLKTRVSVTFHTTDERIVQALIGDKYRLVREPAGEA